MAVDRAGPGFRHLDHQDHVTEIGTREPGGCYGICAICGAHGRKLRIIALTDFVGWACEECREQLWKSTPRLYCPSFEQTEPSE